MHPFRSAALAAVLELDGGRRRQPCGRAGSDRHRHQREFRAAPPLPVYEQPPIPDPDHLLIPRLLGGDSADYDYYFVLSDLGPRA